MAKMYYNRDEAISKLGCTDEQFRGLVRSGKLREFRDAGKLNYRVDEVDRLAAGPMEGSTGYGSGMLSVEDTDIALTPVDSGGLPAVSDTPPGGSDAPIDLSGSDTGLSLDLGSTGPRLEDSPPPSGSGSGKIVLEDSGGADALSLEEVDKDAVQGMKKDDTVITNIGISVFDDDDLEISADPMAKTLMTGGDEHLGLDGSGGGSGLLDLTRESDDTSLGAELLEGIDLGDTAETVAQSAATETAEPVPSTEDEMMAAQTAPVMMMQPVGMVEEVSPAFTGLLIAAAIVLFLAGSMTMAVSQSLEALPGYLQWMADAFWISLGGAIAVGGLFALVGWLMGRPPSPRPVTVAKKEAKGRKK
jgi:hypothetical protein